MGIKGICHIPLEARRRGGQTCAARHWTSEHQAAAGRAGYWAAVAKHGEARILAAAIAKQREHPSRPEQAVIAILRRLAVQPYIHVYQPWDDRRYTVDFAWPAARVAVEVLGGVHFKPELAHDPERFDRLPAKLERLRADGWRVLTLDIRDQAAWPAQLAAFLADLAEIPF